MENTWTACPSSFTGIRIRVLKWFVTEDNSFTVVVKAKSTEADASANPRSVEESRTLQIVTGSQFDDF